MAKSSNNKIALLLIVALLVIVSLAESREIGFLKETDSPPSAPSCFEVYSVARGDTCSAVAEEFNLSTALFDSINPNLDCDFLFVGQWLCVDGSA